MLSTIKMRPGSAAIAAIAAIGIAVCESHHRIPAFRLWSFAAIFVVIAALTVTVPSRLRNLGLTLAAIAFGFFGLELAAVILTPKLGSLTVTPRWIVLKPDLGFGFDQPMVIHSRKTDPDGGIIFDAHYTIDDRLNRHVRSAPVGPTTVFFGDSFTFGEGLDDAGTLPQLYADLRPEQRVLNLAVTGYSPQQFLRAMETGSQSATIGPAAKTFIFLTSPFHAARTSCKEPWTNNAPRYTRVETDLAYAGPCYSGLALMWHEYWANTAFYRLAIRPYATRLTHEDVSLYIDVLAKAVARARERYGVTTLVPFVRVGDAYLRGTGWTDSSIISALEERGVRVEDVTLPIDPALGYFIKGDGHPTVAANAIWAREIATLANPEQSARTADAPP